MAEKRVRLDPPDAAGRPLSLQEQLTRERAHSALLAAELAALRRVRRPGLAPVPALTRAPWPCRAGRGWARAGSSAQRS